MHFTFKIFGYVFHFGFRKPLVPKLTARERALDAFNNPEKYGVSPQAVSAHFEKYGSAYYQSVSPTKKLTS